MPASRASPGASCTCTRHVRARRSAARIRTVSAALRPNARSAAIGSAREVGGRGQEPEYRGRDPIPYDASMRTLLLALLSLILGGSIHAQDEERPNILFLFADDHRPDAVGAYGNPHIETPVIDALVERGFSFRRTYCMGSIHGAVCQPSRAMLLSGRTLYRVPMDLRDTPTLGEVLRRAGYATFGTGKWHNGGASFLRSFETGREVMLGGMSNHLAVPVQDVRPDGTFSERRIAEGFSSELFADAAIDFLSGLDPDDERPFFAYVSFTSPHDPRQPPDEYLELYDERPPPLPANFMPQHPFHNGWMTGRDESLAAWPRTPEVVGEQLAEYYGMITHMDAQIGRVLAALEASGRADDTIIVFSADHGLAVGSHGLLGKQSVYEHAMGCSAGHRRARASTTVIPTRSRTSTTSCRRSWARPASTCPTESRAATSARCGSAKRRGVRDSLYLTYENKMRAVTDGRWKLIRYPLLDREQLFDLRDGPRRARGPRLGSGAAGAPGERCGRSWSGTMPPSTTRTRSWSPSPAARRQTSPAASASPTRTSRSGSARSTSPTRKPRGRTSCSSWSTTWAPSGSRPAAATCRRRTSTASPRRARAS